MGILPVQPPACELCQRQFKGPYEVRQKTKRKLEDGVDVDDNVYYEFRGSEAGRHGGDRCSQCYRRRVSVGGGTNLEHVRNWPAFMHLHVLLNAEPNHVTAKNEISVGYRVVRDETLNQWIVWIMEFAHVHAWNHCPTVLGGSDLKQISIDESFWQRGRTNKSMAPGSGPALTEPTWIWGAVEVGTDGKNRRCLFRIIRKAADTVDGKPRGTAELTRFIKAHISRGHTVVSDGWKATRSVHPQPSNQERDQQTLFVSCEQFGFHGVTDPEAFWETS